MNHGGTVGTQPQPQPQQQRLVPVDDVVCCASFVVRRLMFQICDVSVLDFDVFDGDDDTQKRRNLRLTVVCQHPFHSHSRSWGFVGCNFSAKKQEQKQRQRQNPSLAIAHTTPLISSKKQSQSRQKQKWAGKIIIKRLIKKNGEARNKQETTIWPNRQNTTQGTSRDVDLFLLLIADKRLFLTFFLFCCFVSHS